MSFQEILPLVNLLPHHEKFQLVQLLLTQLAQEEGITLISQQSVDDNGKKAAAILQRMAERQALSEIVDPVVWQRELRQDRPLTGRE